MSSVQLNVTWSGGIAQSNVFQISGAGSPTADTTAPTIPLQPAIALNSSSQPVLSWLASNDPSPPGQLRSGMAGYPVTRGSSVLTTVASPNTDFAAVLTAADIGAPTTAGSTTQTGSALTIVSYGQDFYGVSDAGQFDGVQVTGDFSAGCVVQSLSGSAGQEFAKTGICARNAIGGTGTNGPGSPNVCLAACPPSLGGGTLMTGRTSQGGTSLTYAGNTSVYMAPVWLFMSRVGNVFTGYTSPDGINFTQLSQQTVALASSVYVGFFATTHDASGASFITAQLTQTFISQDAPLTYTDTSVSQAGSPQTLTYAVNAADLAGNVSTGAPILSVTIPASGGGGGGFGVKVTSGIITNLSGAALAQTGTICISGLETLNGNGARHAGFATATQAQWAQALTKWGTAGGRNAQAQPKIARFQLHSAPILGVSGVLSLTDNAQWFTYNAGGGLMAFAYPGQTPAQSATTYLNTLKAVAAATTTAGWVCNFCIAIDSIIEPNGTRHMGFGQVYGPGPDALAAWKILAATFKNNSAVTFELYNEVLVTAVVNSNGTYGTYGDGDPYTGNAYTGPTVPGADMTTYVNAVSTATVVTPPAGQAGGPNPGVSGAGMYNNTVPDAIFHPICASYMLAGINEMIAAIRAQGATNICWPGLPSFSGGIDCGTSIASQIHDSANNWGFAYHCYGQGHFAAAQALQAAGYPILMTEADGGDFTKANGGWGYNKCVQAKISYSFGSNGWNNYAAQSNIMNSANASSPLVHVPENQSMPTPNGSN